MLCDFCSICSQRALRHPKLSFYLLHPRSLKKPFPSSIKNMILLQGMQNTCWWLKAKQAICDHSQLIHSTCKSILDFIKQRISLFCFRCSFLTPVLEHIVLNLVLGSTLQKDTWLLEQVWGRTMKMIRKMRHLSYDNRLRELAGIVQPGEDAGKTLLQTFSS